MDKRMDWLIWYPHNKLTGGISYPAEVRNDQPLNTAINNTIVRGKQSRCADQYRGWDFLDPARKTHSLGSAFLPSTPENVGAGVGLWKQCWHVINRKKVVRQHLKKTNKIVQLKYEWNLVIIIKCGETEKWKLVTQAWNVR